MNPIASATSPDAKQAAATLAVLPVGSWEQHGPSLPLSTDTLIACAITRQLAASHAVMELPPITISCSHEHSDWPGTVSIRHRTLSVLIEDIADSLRRSGVNQLVLVNAHGGNCVLSNIVQEGNARFPRSTALFPRSDDWRAARDAAGVRSAYQDDMHAGELETSILLQAYPEVVRPGWQELDHTSGREQLLIHGMSAYTKTGVIGQPSFASAEKGQLLLAHLVERFGRLLGALQR